MIDAKNIPLNCGTISGTGIPKYIFRKPSIGGDRLKLYVQPVNRILSVSSPAYTTNYDASIYRYNTGSSITDIQVTLDNKENIPVTIYSENTNVLLNPFNNICSGVQTGNTSTNNVRIIASGTNLVTDFNIQNVTVQCNIGTNIDAFSTFVNGSLAKHCSDSIDSRLINKNSTTDKNIFSVQNHSTSTYQRNTSCWVYDVNLTCISPWNSMDNNLRAGTLISPCHIVFASHYPINTGSTIRFVALDNTVVNKTLIDKIDIGGDITLGILDSDVSNNISFAKILPSNWSSYLPTIFRNETSQNAIYRIPSLSLDQEEKALVTEFYAFVSTTLQGAINRPTSNYLDPNSLLDPYPNRFAFSEFIISGDSGNPTFLIINGELVLLMTFTSPGSGPFFASRINDLNTNMNLLWTRNNRSGSSYTVTTTNLSSFTSY